MARNGDDKKPKKRREPRLPERGLFAPADATRAVPSAARQNAPGLLDMGIGVARNIYQGLNAFAGRGLDILEGKPVEELSLKNIMLGNPDTEEELGAMVVGAHVPVVGDVMDAADVVQGVKNRQWGRAGMGAVALALGPFVTLRGGRRVRASSEAAAQEAQQIIDAGRHAPAIKDPFTGEPIVTGMAHDMEDLPIGIQDYYRTADAKDVASGQGFVHSDTGPTLLSRDETAARTNARKGESSDVRQAETEAANAQPLPLLEDEGDTWPTAQIDAAKKLPPRERLAEYERITREQDLMGLEADDLWDELNLDWDEIEAQPAARAGQTAAMREHNIPDVGFEQVDPKRFHDAIAQAGNTKKGDVKLKDMLTVYSPDEYAGMRTFLSSDGKTGYAIKSDGDLVSVFNTGQRGAGSAAVLSGIENGATKLDAFEPFLPDLYNKLGFEPVRAEGNWTPGGPPVTYMKLRDELQANPQLARERVGTHGAYNAPTPVQDFENMIVDARAASEARAKNTMRSKKSFEEARQEVLANLLPHEREGLTPKMLDQITENYLRAPEPRSIASLVIGGAPGAEWYDPVAEGLHQMFGDDAPRFAALMAALSPQADVKNNLDWALGAWERWQQLGRPGKEITDAQLDDIVRTSGAMFAGGAKKGGLYHNNMKRIFGASNDELLDLPTLEHGGFLTGPKVDPFYGNLLGETQRVVQDTHMAQGFGTTAKDIGSKSRNLASTAALRAAGKEVEALTGVALDPRQLQAAYWTSIKSMRDAARGPTLEALARSELQRTGGQWGQTVFGQSVRDVPSFQTMLHEDPSRTILQRLGISEPPPAPKLPEHGFDPSLIRPQDLIEHAQRSDLAKNAAIAQKDAKKAAKEAGTKVPPRTAQEWGYLYGLGPAIAAPAGFRAVRGLLEPDDEQQKRSLFNLSRPSIWQ